VSDTSTSAGAALWRFIKEIVIILVVALGLSFLVRTFIVQAFYVPSQSMEDTLIPNDRILASKLSTRFGGVKRGEIVVFRDPSDWLDAAQKEPCRRHRRRSGVGGDCCPATPVTTSSNG
jgi:signal peptidase I